jgi:DNA-binding transcriptional MocR family regulator
MNKLVTANRLPSETQIAKAFGVSRISSVSAATKSLEFLGIVEKKAEWQLGMNSPSVGRSDRHGASCRGDRGNAKAYGKTSVCRTRGRGET